MPLTREEVEQVAMVARLELSEEEAENYTQELNSILQYVDKLHELDLKNVEPMVHVLTINNVFREDKVGEGLSRDAALDNAPRKEDGQFIVPKIV
ncbi:MAG: Asp-tRNA(Asn)/Glu-tRNA(Gln) amidotransferase subunit GatC [Clostridia bacterium]|nr:Asp-tRNA(Asn)/Glu-tRNA(Gln) amidotransferase subunit GatC [Clostridia bacterium]